MRHDLGVTARRDVGPRRIATRTTDPGDTSEMSKGIVVPFSRLVLYHREIGIHRGRRAGFRDVFGFGSLYGLPFTRLAAKVKDAYEGRRVPSHEGWDDQRAALQWFVEKGVAGIYVLDTKPIRVMPSHYQQYFITDGHHRALALFILGENEVRAKVRH